MRDSTEYEALFQRGHAHGLTGDDDNAIEDYTRAISIKPNMTALYCRALAYYRKHDYNRAIADFKSLLPLANSLEMKRDIEEIIKILEKEKKEREISTVAEVLPPSPCAMSVEQIPKDFVVEGNVK